MSSVVAKLLMTSRMTEFSSYGCFGVFGDSTSGNCFKSELALIGGVVGFAQDLQFDWS